MSETVIVALPSEEDYVNRISSEVKPHMTLLYLGENLSMDHLPEVVRYLEHVAKTSMKRFGLSVDRRGELGDKDADVLFFEDGWQTKEIQEVQGYLRSDPHIARAYDLSKQYPKWVPHLTLGYPETPAKEDPRDNPVFHYVDFDRIAIWTGDYDGPEFRLKGYEYPMVEHSATSLIGESFVDDILENDISHYGVKGMQWGVRKDNSGPTGVALKTKPGKRVKATGGKFEAPSEDAKDAATKKQIARKSTPDALSNQDLKKLVERMQLESNYNRLLKEQQGNDIVRKLFTNKKYRDQSIDNLEGLRDTSVSLINKAKRSTPGSAINRTDLSKIGR